MKLVFSTIGCPDWSHDEMIAKGVASGFEGVELGIRDRAPNYSPDVPLETARETARRFRDGGLPIHTASGYSRFAFEEAGMVRENETLLAKLIDLAEAFEAPYVRVQAGIIPEGADRDAMVETVSNAFRPLARKAHDQGVVLALETHDDWCSAAQVMPIVERVDSKAFQVIYDVQNSIASNTEPWEATYAGLKDHVAYLHIKDAYRNPAGEWVHTMLGAGDLPLVPLLAQLKADGYDGTFSFEWEKMWHPEIEPPERAFPQFVHKFKSVWKSV